MSFWYVFIMQPYDAVSYTSLVFKGEFLLNSVVT